MSFGVTVSATDMQDGILSEFTWQVATGGYCWTDTNWGRALTERPDQPEPPRRYRPLDRRNAGLFREFAALKPTEDAVLQFANTYGMLGPPITRWSVLEGQRLIMSPDGVAFAKRLAHRGAIPKTQVPGPALESFDASPDPDEDHCWTAQIASLAATLGLDRREFPLLAGRPDASALTDDFRSGFLRAKVNTVLHQTCGPTLTWTGRKPRFGLSWGPRSLLGAVWLQAAMALTGEKKFQPCANAHCEKTIEISLDEGFRQGTMFCSAACKMQDYRARRRKARDLAKRGWTAARIAKYVKRDTKIVRGWLKAR